MYQKKLNYSLAKNEDTIIPGIYILSKTLMINDKECIIITLEGLDKFTENLLFAHQLRNIIFILSSLVIYEGNDNLEITKQNFINIFKQIKTIKSSNIKKDLTKDYMPRLLCEINISNVDETNNTNITSFVNEVSNKKLFKQFDLFNKYNKEKKSLNYKLKWIKDNFDIKKLNKIELNENVVYNLIENLCEKFNVNEMPIIDVLLENIILSAMKGTTEKIISQFKNKFKNFIKDSQSQNQSLNYYDLISFYINFHKEESLTNFCKSKMSSFILLQNAEPYLQKILISTFEEIETVFKSHKTKYEELINSFGVRVCNKSDPKNIQEMRESINNLSKNLKKYFIPIISYKMFSFDNSLNVKVIKYVINKLSKIGENLKNLVENEKQSIKDQYNEQKNKILEENKNREKELYENSVREIKNKEREFSTTLEIESKKYKFLEEYLETFEEENQKKINDLEIRINELSKENNILKNKKLITSEEANINGVKSDFVFVKNKLIEYKTNIDNINNQININFQSKINDKEGNKLLDVKFEDWKVKFEKLIIDNFNSINNYEEKIIELENLDFEITKLKIELKEEKQNYLVLQMQLDNEKKKYEQLKSLLEDRNTLIKAYEEKINLQLKDIENYQKNKEKLEVDLNQAIVNYRMKEEENDVLVLVFCSVFRKKKDVYEQNIKKLSADVIEVIESLNKKYVFFKK